MSEVKIKRGGSTESADLDDCVRSAGYGLIQQRLAKLRQQYIDQLIAAKPEEVNRIQGQIAALGTTLEVPEILRREYAAKRKQNE